MILRIKEVNYPVFKDKHNFKGEPQINSFFSTVTPLKKYIFAFEKFEKQCIENRKKYFKDLPYFNYPRVSSAMLELDEITNHKRAQERAKSHNKFFKYGLTVQENEKLFGNFLEDINRRGIQMLIFVPPVTELYRNYIEPKLKFEYYSRMSALQKKYNFTLIDLFNSNVFGNGDFLDYDHPNDNGAKKLGEILSREIDLKK